LLHSVVQLTYQSKKSHRIYCIEFTSSYATEQTMIFFSKMLKLKFYII